MLAKIYIIVTMLIILYSLFSGFYYLIKDNGDSKRLLVALTWRIGLSLFLFLSLFVLYWLGYIQPHGIQQ